MKSCEVLWDGADHAWEWNITVTSTITDNVVDRPKTSKIIFSLGQSNMTIENISFHFGRFRWSNNIFVMCFLFCLGSLLFQCVYWWSKSRFHRHHNIPREMFHIDDVFRIIIGLVFGICICRISCPSDINKIFCLEPPPRKMGKEFR